MTRQIPLAVSRQAELDVANSASENGLVNVSVLAEALRNQHLHENIALEDIERCVLSLATLRGAIVVFDRAAESANVFANLQDGPTQTYGNG